MLTLNFIENFSNAMLEKIRLLTKYQFLISAIFIKMQNLGLSFFYCGIWDKFLYKTYVQSKDIQIAFKTVDNRVNIYSEMKTEYNIL